MASLLSNFNKHGPISPQSSRLDCTFYQSQGLSTMCDCRRPRCRACRAVKQEPKDEQVCNEEDGQLSSPEPSISQQKFKNWAEYWADHESKKPFPHDLGVELAISSKKFSLSQKWPFNLKLALTNLHTSTDERETFYLAQSEPIRAFHRSSTSGPHISIKLVEGSDYREYPLIAKYRIELCTKIEVKYITSSNFSRRTSLEYSVGDFKPLMPGKTLTICSAFTNISVEAEGLEATGNERLCLKEKLFVGKQYLVELENGASLIWIEPDILAELGRQHFTVAE